MINDEEQMLGRRNHAMATDKQKTVLSSLFWFDLRVSVPLWQAFSYPMTFTDKEIL